MSPVGTARWYGVSCPAYAIAGRDLEPDEEGELEMVVQREPGQPALTRGLRHAQATAHCTRDREGAQPPALESITLTRRTIWWNR